MNEPPTWEDVRRKINGLWSRYDPTPEEREFITRRLSSLNQRWLDAAVEAYRAASASGVFHIAELLEHYRRIANTGTEREARKRSPDGSDAARWAAERERDRLEAIAVLERADRDSIRTAVAELRAEGWIGREPLPTRFAEWGTNALFAVQSRLTRTAAKV
jgi:hypothetical protein